MILSLSWCGINSRTSRRASQFAAGYDEANLPVERAGLARMRRALLARASGATIELGAGTGLNLPHYPPAVTRLVLSEPDPHMRARLNAKVGPAGRAVEVTENPAESLREPDSTFDTAVCTLVLCTVPSPQAALAEIMRILKPGGELLFLEHVRSERPLLALLQHAATPIYARVAGGCHPNRDTVARIQAAGFRIETLRREPAPETPLLERELVIGAGQAP